MRTSLGPGLRLSRPKDQTRPDFQTLGAVDIHHEAGGRML